MQPKSPNPDFDFMLKANQPAGRRLPGLNLPRPVRLTLWAAVAVILLIIIVSIFSGRGGGSTQAIAGVLARGQETLRVTTLVQQRLNLQDPQTQALAATVASALTSDQVQLKSYLARNHTKISSAQLSVDTDTGTDSSLQAASQNNNLDDAYLSYLRTSLAKYEQDLSDAYKLAGPNGKTILNNASISTTTLLSSRPLSSAMNFTCNAAGATAC